MLRDLSEFFDPTLRLPIKGKVYVVDPDAATGIYCQRLFTTATAAFVGADVSPADLAALELNDAEEADLYPRVLGSAYQQMLDDGLPWPWIKHAGTTALMWLGLGMEAAESFWVEAPQGEARRPDPQDHRVPAKKTAKKAAATRSRRSAGSPATSSPVDPQVETGTSSPS